MNYIKCCSGIICDYKWNFVGVFFSFVVILFLSTFLLTIRNYHSYYADIKFGFIPDVALTFDLPVKTDDLDALIEEIKAKFTINHVIQGGVKKIKDASFPVQNNWGNKNAETIEKNITVLGIDFRGNRKITILQDDREIKCEVLNIGKFGSWFIEIEKTGKIAEGICSLAVGEQKIEFLVTDYGSFFKLRYHNPDNGRCDLLYKFLNDFIERFIDTRYSGINVDRFANLENQRGNSYEFDIHQKRKILAYAGIIFGKFQERIPALLSLDLMRSINKYGYITETELRYDNHEYKLQVIDAFNFEPDQLFNKSVALINIHAFQKIFNFTSGYNLIYLYCDDSNSEQIVSYVQQKYPNVNHILRNDVISGFNKQRIVINFCVALLYVLFFAIVFCIVFIRLLKFYSVFQDELTLFKLYGFGLYIYS